jgi:hypothetical protein
MAKLNKPQKFRWDADICNRQDSIIDSIVRTASEENRRIDDSMVFHWASRSVFADLCFGNGVDLDTVTEGQYLRWFHSVNDAVSEIQGEIEQQAFLDNVEVKHDSDESETK